MLIMPRLFRRCILATFRRSKKNIKMLSTKPPSKVRKSKPDSTAQKIRMDDPESNINFRIAILHSVCAPTKIRQTLETPVRQQQLRAVAVTKPYASNGSRD